MPPTPHPLSLMPALLALDLGTSSAKAALRDLEGTTLAVGSAEYPIRRPADGGTEQDPAHWVRAAVSQLVDAVPTPAILPGSGRSILTRL